MADSPFEIGSEIEVTPFLYATPLVVKIMSVESFAHGGSAKIFKGLAKVPYRPYEVALKVISHVVSKDRSELVRRELQTVTRLAERSMRRILPFIGTASVGSHPIIVTEYMKNGNMVQYCQHYPGADRQRLLIQVAEAVYWLHDFKNLVHGDLKCENVLINDDEDAVLADFGLSTLIEQEASNVTTCTDIRNMNTYRFAAPELLGIGVCASESGARQRSKTPKGDVYAFGMLVLQAFTGTHPWPHLPRPETVFIALMSRTVHPRPIQTAKNEWNGIEGGLTNRWWDVCLQCWQYEPDKRPDMYQVWDALRGDFYLHEGMLERQQHLRIIGLNEPRRSPRAGSPSLSEGSDSLSSAGATGPHSTPRARSPAEVTASALLGAADALLRPGNLLQLELRPSEREPEPTQSMRADRAPKTPRAPKPVAGGSRMESADVGGGNTMDGGLVTFFRGAQRESPWNDFPKWTVHVQPHAIVPSQTHLTPSPAMESSFPQHQQPQPQQQWNPAFGQQPQQQQQQQPEFTMMSELTNDDWWQQFHMPGWFGNMQPQHAVQHQQMDHHALQHQMSGPLDFAMQQEPFGFV